MKNLKNFYITIIALLCIVRQQLFSQSSSASNTQISTAQFLGWNTAGIVADLNLKTEQPQNINFYTNAGASSFNNLHMIIRGNNNMGTFTNNSGYVGIGNDMPMSILHIGESNCYSGQTCSNGTFAGG